MNNKQFAQELYDLIKVNAVKNSQNDDWARLSRKFGNDARKAIGKYVQDKSIEVSGDTINIGKHLRITVEAV